MRYRNKTCLVATMHEKEKAIGPSFESILGFQVELGLLNTDSLGTFTGEIERSLSAKECAKTKCLRALSTYGNRIGIANEGSFGPHPIMPFSAAGHEIYFFADYELGFELSVSKIISKTNFDATFVSDYDSILAFGKKVLFPSHALIVRPNNGEDKNICYKGIQSFQDLYEAFQVCRSASLDGLVRVETDMRAHKNPTRMKQLRLFAHELAQRLNTSCPNCSIPGWGPVDCISGLSCADCGAETLKIRTVIWGCCLCAHQVGIPVKEREANPRYCPLCNP